MADQERTTSTVYLRGLPTRLVREAKAAAARRGITLTRYVTEALRRHLSAAGSSSADVPEDLQAGLVYYETHASELADRYRGQYVAVGAAGVVGHDRDFDRLARRVFDARGSRPVLIRRAGAEPQVARLRSPRRVRA